MSLALPNWCSWNIGSKRLNDAENTGPNGAKAVKMENGTEAAASGGMGGKGNGKGRRPRPTTRRARAVLQESEKEKYISNLKYIFHRLKKNP